MRKENRILFSVILFLVIALSAWPVYVLASACVSYFIDLVGFQDFFTQRPKRLWLNEFMNGWVSSAPVAVAIGFVAVIDMQLLTRQRFTYLISGIFLPVSLVALGVFFFKDYAYQHLPTFLATGCILWAIYRLSEIISRIER